MTLSGVRSSWLASATKRRIRSSDSRAVASDSDWARNAVSIWLSMPFSALPSRPTSVPRVDVRDALGQVAGGDGLRRVLDLDQRPQAGPYDRDPEAGDQDEDDAAHDELHADEAPGGAARVAEVGGGDREPGARRLDVHPPADVAGDRADRDRVAGVRGEPGGVLRDVRVGLDGPPERARWNAR